MISKRVCCRLCNCEGTHGTVLCGDHLEGFYYAVRLLQKTRYSCATKELAEAITAPQPESADAL